MTTNNIYYFNRKYVKTQLKKFKYMKNIKFN